MAELSGLEVFALANEIEKSLRGTYVKNVYSLGPSQVLRFGGGEGEDVLVLVSPRFGVWISKKVSERAETTPFTTRLRQELGRGRFVSARQMDHDRIFDLVLGEDNKHFIVEMMPPGNLVVTDSSYNIKVILNEVRSTSRRLNRGATYTGPPQRKSFPSNATISDVASALEKSRTAGEAVGRTFSLPRKYVTEVIARLRIEDATPSSQLKGREMEVLGVLKGLVKEAEDSPRPRVCEASGGDEIFVVETKAFRMVRTSENLSDLCDELLLGPATAEEEAQLSPVERKRQELQSTISALRREIEVIRAESSRLRVLAGKANEETNSTDLKAILDSAGIADRLGIATSQSAASAIYDKAKLLEKKAIEAEDAATDLNRKLRKGPEKEKTKKVELRRRRYEWYEKFRWFFTTEGKLAVGGRDAQSNSILVRRHIEPHDTVYHADLFGSPFFVLKGGSEQTVAECAEVAQATVAFSSAWKTGLGAADAYWVRSDQVSTAAPSGEFLPRGGFMITGKKNFVPRNLVEMAVGLDSTGRVVSGPENAVRKVSLGYVTLRPQKEKGSETAKRVVKDLVSLVGPELPEAISLDEVMKMLPTGGGKVIRKSQGDSKGLEARNA